MNPEFENVLVNLFTVAPYITFLLAGIGVATIACLLWAAIKPVICFLGTSQRHMVTVSAYCLIVAGSVLLGSSQMEKGALLGGGLSATILGALTLVVFWFRQWVKWTYNEKE